MEPPQVLRIKRKRGQDPLQALILEDKQGAKRSKPSSPISSGTRTPVNEEKLNFYFKLTRTDDTTIGHDEQLLATILSETNQTESRNFVIPKKQSEEDIVVPHELSDMVNDFMLNNSETASSRKKRHGSTISSSPTTAPIDDDEYVYDVYQLSTTTDENHPKSQIGYIKFFEDDEEEFNGSEPSVDKLAFSDNEDSNAEDYYQNDYPEDEDADIQDDIHDGYEETGLELEADQLQDLYDYMLQNDVKLVDNYDSADDADYVFNEDDEDEEDSDEYAYDSYDDDNGQEFQRQHFFDNESDDELATHRDKIFGKLQKMIDEADD